MDMNALFLFVYFLMLVLGFPLILLAGEVLNSYKKINKPHAKRPGGWAAYLLLGAVLLIAGAWGVVDNRGEIDRLSGPRPSLPSAVPSDVSLVDDTKAADGMSLLVPYGLRKSIQVNFPEQRSIRRYWSGSAPEFAIEEPVGKTFKAESQTKSWGSAIISNAPLTELKPFTPWLKATFAVDRAYLHQWITANARLRTTYPVFSGGGFTNKTTVIVASLRLFVVSPEEYLTVKNDREWEQARTNAWVYFIVSSELVALGIMSLALCPARALHSRAQPRRQNL